MRHLLLCHETAGRSSEAVEGATRLLWPGKHHMCCAMDDWCTRCSSRRQLGKSAGIDGTGRPRPCDGTDPCARALRRAEHSTPRRAAYCFCYCRARCEKAIAFTVNPTRLGRRALGRSRRCREKTRECHDGLPQLSQGVGPPRHRCAPNPRPNRDSRSSQRLTTMKKRAHLRVWTLPAARQSSAMLAPCPPRCTTCRMNFARRSPRSWLRIPRKASSYKAPP